MKLLNLLIFAIIYMLAVAVTATIFNPSQYSAAVDYGIPTQLGNVNPIGTGSGFFGILDNINWGWAFVTFIGGGLSLNIPDIPVFVRALLLLPFYGCLAYFIYCNIPFLPGRKEG